MDTVVKMNKALYWVLQNAPICKSIPFLCFSVLGSNFCYYSTIEEETRAQYLNLDVFYKRTITTKS